MALPPGARLGPYEIVSLVGAGGMGEVYKAKDTRLDRMVAIKVSNTQFSERFERESRAVAALSHPNICQLYDVGDNYLVMEYIDGSPVSPPDSPRRLLELAVQMADGLGAAHSAGFIHRDLKPDNILVTRDGRVKILDFGLSKQAQRSPDAEAMTLTPTDPGTVVGTVAYMSPEQARGQALDARSDQFSFGLILYELAVGKRAFVRDSTAETMAAIIREDAAPLPAGVPAPLQWVIARCLAKDPDDRYDSTRDLYRELRQIQGRLSENISSVQMPLARHRHWWFPALIALALCLGFATVFSILTRGRETPAATFQRLTFRRGAIRAARFAPEGRTIIYTAAWEGRPPEIFSTRPDSSESRALGFSAANILAVSALGEMALLLKPHGHLALADPMPDRGLLARAPLAGGASREILEDVQLADWGPDGNLAIVRAVGERTRVEFPIGRLLYETTNKILAMRVAPRGDLVAVAEHARGFGTNGAIEVFDSDGKKRTLASDLVGDFFDLAWTPAGDEIWFDSGIEGSTTLRAITLSGKQRVIAQTPDRMQILDISADHRVLVNRVLWRVGVLGMPPGEKTEVDLSWLDASEVDDVTPDGKTLLITEFGEGGGPSTWGVYLRRSDGSPAVRLGDGQAMSLSPDGKWALAMVRTSPPQLILWPTGAGTARKLERGGISDYSWANWLPDGKRILFVGTEPGHGPRSYLQAIDEDKPHPLTPEGVSLPLEPTVSPDGQSFFAIDTNQRAWLYPLRAGEPHPIPGLEPFDIPVGWTADGRSLFMFPSQESSARVYRVDVITGRKALWKQLMPADPAAIKDIYAVHVAADGGWYFYSYWRALSDLYLVQGWK